MQLISTHHFALITGASSGIGESIAKVLAQKGKKLVLVARREERLKKIAAELSTQYKVQVETIACDLGQAGTIVKLMEEMKSKKIDVDLLINNAGVGTFAPLTEASWEQQKAMIDLNMTSLTHMAQVMSKIWKTEKRGGQILNVASVGAYFPIGNFSVYTASKAYVKALSLALREELKHDEIQVSCLCPGGTRTEFMEHANQAITNLGELSMMSADECAKVAYEGMRKNKAIIIPGVTNKLTCLLSRFVGESFGVMASTKLFSLAVHQKNQERLV